MKILYSVFWCEILSHLFWLFYQLFHYDLQLPCEVVIITPNLKKKQNLKTELSDVLKVTKFSNGTEPQAPSSCHSYSEKILGGIC